MTRSHNIIYISKRLWIVIIIHQFKNKIFTIFFLFVFHVLYYKMCSEHFSASLLIFIAWIYFILDKNAQKKTKKMRTIFIGFLHGFDGTLNCISICTWKQNQCKWLFLRMNKCLFIYRFFFCFQHRRFFNLNKYTQQLIIN